MGKHDWRQTTEEAAALCAACGAALTTENQDGQCAGPDEFEELARFAEAHHGEQPLHEIMHGLRVDVPYRIRNILRTERDVLRARLAESLAERTQMLSRMLCAPHASIEHHREPGCVRCRINQLKEAAEADKVWIAELEVENSRLKAALAKAPCLDDAGNPRSDCGQCDYCHARAKQPKPEGQGG